MAGHVRSLVDAFGELGASHVLGRPFTQETIKELGSLRPRRFRPSPHGVTTLKGECGLCCRQGEEDARIIVDAETVEEAEGLGYWMLVEGGLIQLHDIGVIVRVEPVVL